MLNLSDKDLDRFSQEAAQQHEPGDIIGPKFWDKLEARLDRDLGKVTPNPARGIRRLPYYYAPALLVLLGVSYYLVRINSKSHRGISSGSPPLSVTQPASADPLKPVPSSSNPVPSNSLNSTPTAPSKTIQYPGATSASADASTNAPAAPARPDANITPVRSHAPSNANTSPTSTDLTNSNHSFSLRHHHNKLTDSKPNKSVDLADNSTTGATTVTITTRSPLDLTYSAVRGPSRLAHTGRISDSALRAFNLSTIRQPIRDRVLHINRSLAFGLVGGPDYASVNSLSGQRPGSTIGVTVDYQFLNHLYIGTGLLFTKKVFAAFPEDYHVPDTFYRANGMGMGGGINIIKGTFNMLEVPLNLRWDFNTSDNSLFFIGIGTSSYFFTSQNCGYYFNFYNPRTLEYKEITYSNQPSSLFASINFSAGAEFGLTNSLSVLAGGYVKAPTRGIGFGQVNMTSVGLTFGLRYAPVLRRKR